MTEYRIEELAAEADIGVASLRAYQSQGLIPPPRHVGRIALYGDGHLARLRRISEMKARGHSLRSIAEHFQQPSVPAVTGGGEQLRLREVAQRSGMPIEMLRSLEASGMLTPLHGDDGAYYTDADVAAVECVLLLIGSGIPFDRFLDVAQPQLHAGTAVAAGATELFDRYVADRLPAGLPGDTGDAFAAMAAAIGRLAGYLMERQVLARRATALDGVAEQRGVGD